MSLLIFYFLLAIGVSFFCSVSEAVLLSLRPSYIASLNSTLKTSKILKQLQNNLDKPLAAILTANTIAHTIGAAGVGAQAAVVFGNEYLGIVSAVLTFAILVFSEIIPKTLGAVYWQELAPTFGLLINFLTTLLSPFVWCSERLTRLLSRQGVSMFTYSRDEVLAMVEIGKQEGVLEVKEHKIVSNLMKLQQLCVRDIMTPRSVVFMVKETMTVQDFFTEHANSAFSRIPVFGKNVDDITGYVLKTDLLIAQARDEFTRTLSEFIREFVVIPDLSNSSDVYDRLMREKRHIALVVDEYGTVQGLVTQEDVVETLIGLEITDELDNVEDMQVLARKRWEERMKAIGISPESLIVK